MDDTNISNHNHFINNLSNTSDQIIKNSNLRKPVIGFRNALNLIHEKQRNQNLSQSLLFSQFTDENYNKLDDKQDISKNNNNNCISKNPIEHVMNSIIEDKQKIESLSNDLNEKSIVVNHNHININNNHHHNNNVLIYENNHVISNCNDQNSLSKTIKRIYSISSDSDNDIILNNQNILKVNTPQNMNTLSNNVILSNNSYDNHEYDCLTNNSLTSLPYKNNFQDNDIVELLMSSSSSNSSRSSSIIDDSYSYKDELNQNYPILSETNSNHSKKSKNIISTSDRVLSKRNQSNQVSFIDIHNNKNCNERNVLVDENNYDSNIITLLSNSDSESDDIEFYFDNTDININQINNKNNTNKTHQLNSNQTNNKEITLIAFMDGKLQNNVNEKKKTKKRQLKLAHQADESIIPPLEISCYIHDVLNPRYDTLDPNPDITLLFRIYNKYFFKNSLSSVYITWSKRMTLCAGICRYKRQTKECIISLSTPLLQFRPRGDTVNTLLHEMIHAYLFISVFNTDHTDHGPLFQKYMNNINKQCGSNITIYHTFFQEVKQCQQHVWKCDGKCVQKPPYFGIVRRSMNRPPQPADWWFAEHQKTCGGTFHKISSPPRIEKKKKKTKDKIDKTNNESKQNDISKYLS